MGNSIFTGRYTTQNTEDMVVFIIGMRVNNPLAVHKWGSVFAAMPGMIRELYMHKEDLGFLSMESYFGFRTTAMIQYWRSMDDLLAYAKNDRHLTAWRNFNKKSGGNGAVGIYHETYQIKGGNYESVFVNMPKHGLGKAVSASPITSELDSAQQRLNSKK